MGFEDVETGSGEILAADSEVAVIVAPADPSFGEKVLEIASGSDAAATAEVETAVEIVAATAAVGTARGAESWVELAWVVGSEGAVEVAMVVGMAGVAEPAQAVPPAALVGTGVSAARVVTRMTTMTMMLATILQLDPRGDAY